MTQCKIATYDGPPEKDIVVRCDLEEGHEGPHEWHDPVVTVGQFTTMSHVMRWQS